MGVREEFRSGGRGRLVATCAALGATLIAVGCGGDDDFEGEPRPAAPLVVTAKVDDQKVVVSPNEFGAGLVNFTISNQSADPVNLTFVGPAPEDNQQSGDIPPGGVGTLKVNMSEGDYEVTGGERSDAKPGEVTVGPPRPSSSDELLLP